MIWQFLVASSLLTLMPGPDILFILANSMTYGVRASLPVAMGLSSGLMIHSLALACGVAVIFASYPILFDILKYCGAAYLIYLGTRAVLRSLKPKVVSEEPKNPKEKTLADRSFWSLYRQGITMNLLNPKVAIFFPAFLPGFVPADAASPALYIIFLGSIFVLVALTVFSSVGLLSSWISQKVHLERYIQSVPFAVATALLYLAIAVMIVI